MGGLGGICVTAWRLRVAACIAAIGVGWAAAASADVKPELELVALMHQNLAAINEIDEGVIRDDEKRVKKGAEILKANAGLMKGVDLDSLKLDPKKDADFERYSAAQSSAADAISNAAALGDSAAVLLGVNRLIDDACVACHVQIRESDEKRTPRVLFMRSLMSSVQSVNRGIAMDDYALVAREAREIGALAHILTWTQVIGSMFMIEDPADQTEFRGYFETLSSEAIRVEHAATERDPKMISAATQRMLDEGCVSCHASFRDEIRARVKRARTPVDPDR